MFSRISPTWRITNSKKRQDCAVFCRFVHVVYFSNELEEFGTFVVPISQMYIYDKFDYEHQGSARIVNSVSTILKTRWILPSAKSFQQSSSFHRSYAHAKRTNEDNEEYWL